MVKRSSRSSPPIGRRKPSRFSIASLQLFLIDIYLKQLPLLEKIQSIRTPILDAYMRAATLLGDEIFFITFLPFCSWTIDPRLALQLTCLMSACLYFGNVTKNILNIPRPPHPRIQCLGSQETDHGFPSTHTMTGVAVPAFFFIWILNNRPDYFGDIPVRLVMCIVVFISASITFSRNYNGHHSLTDITGGIIFGLTLLVIWVNYVEGRLLDYVLNGSVFLPIVNVCVGALMLKVHPMSIVPTSALGESGLVIGTAVGTVTSNWAFNYFDLIQEPLALRDYRLFGVSTNAFVFHLARYVLGIVLVFLVRILCKALFTHVIKGNFPGTFDLNTKYEQPSLEQTLDHIHNRSTLKVPLKAGIDLPVKYFSYIFISSMIVVGAPYVFYRIGWGSTVETSYYIAKSISH